LGKPYEQETLNEVLQRSFRYNLVDQPALYQVPPIDTVDCQDILLRDAEVIGFDVVNEMVELFFSSSRETVSQIHHSIENRLWTDLAKQAHKLKGAASSIGLNDLWQLAQELETLAQDESPEIAATRERFDSVYDEACQLLVAVWKDVQAQQNAKT